MSAVTKSVATLWDDCPDSTRRIRPGWRDRVGEEEGEYDEWCGVSSD